MLKSNRSSIVSIATTLRLDCLGLNGYRGPVYHLPPSSAKVKNEWSYTSSHHMGLYGVDGGRIYHYLSHT